MLDVKKTLGRILNRLSTTPNVVKDYAFSTSATTNSTTTQQTLYSKTHTSKTGRVLVFGVIPIYTDRNTARAYLYAGSTQIDYHVTNATTAQSITLMGTATVAKNSSVTYSIRFTAQSGAEATVPAYQTYKLMIVDLGGVIKFFNALTPRGWATC